MKSNLISIGQQFLVSMLATTVAGISGLTPADVQKKLTDGNVYIRKEVTGQGGIYNLLESSTLERIGYSSFNGKKLPANVKMALEAVRFTVAVVESSDTGKEPAQLYGNKVADVPAMLRSAHLIINKQGQQIVNQPIGQMLNLGSQEGMCGVDDVYNLPAFRFLEGEQELDIQISFPTEGVSWPTGKKVFVSVELLGARALLS
jgi:hypothetical protein